MTTRARASVLHTLSAMGVCVAIGNGLFTDVAHASILTYEYEGVIESVNFGGQFIGTPLTALFTIDTSKPFVSANQVNNLHVSEFSILSASVTFSGVTFNSMPYENFNQQGAQTGGNRNRINNWNHIDGYNAYDMEIRSGEQVGTWIASNLALRIEDRYSGAMSVPGYIDDLSDYTFGVGFDRASVIVGLTIGSTTSAIGAGPGTLRLVPTPGALALFAAAAPFALRRRRA